MKPISFIKKILLIILTLTVMTSCNSLDSSSSASPEIPRNENPSEGSSSTTTTASAESGSAPEINLPAMSNEMSSEPVESNSRSNSSEVQQQSKIQYAELDDKRLSFTSDIQQAGSLEDLQKCTEAWKITTNDIGTIIVYNGEASKAHKDDNYINELLGIISRTTLEVLDEIPIQPPQALSLGPFAAAAYDQDGNRLWVLYTIGYLVTFELGDSGDVNVFTGELGVGS